MDSPRVPQAAHFAQDPDVIRVAQVKDRDLAQRSRLVGFIFLLELTYRLHKRGQFRIHHVVDILYSMLYSAEGPYPACRVKTTTVHLAGRDWLEPLR